MKKVITLATTLFFAASILAFAASNDEKMLEKEKAAWQAFKDKDEAGFKKVVSADMVAIYEDGMADMAKELSDMKKWDMKSFEISDYKTTSAGSNLVMSSYVVKIEGTFDGKDASGSYNAGTVWHKKGGHGDWMAVFHTNVKQAQPAG